jgi:foldase protein PrsA
LASLCALFLSAAILAGCGGVPGNAVATVDGTNIEKTTFDHWMTIASKGSGSTAPVPVPPDFTACIAAAKKAQAKPKTGQPKQTDAQLKTTCGSQYTQLRDSVLQFLIWNKWYAGETKSMNVTVTDADVRKSFNQEKKQSFPKQADYDKFLKSTGQTEADLLTTVRFNLLGNKIRDSVLKGKDKVTDAQIKTYYDKNQSRFSTPETRDLRIVLTKTEAQAKAAKAAIEGGRSFAAVAKKDSIDEASKSQGGKLAGVGKGQQEKAFDTAIFAARKGALEGPVKTQFGWYVFEVTKITKATHQTLDEAKATIKQLLVTQNQQTALDAFTKGFQERWKKKTDCRDGFVTQYCKNAPKATPTPSAAAGAAPTAAPAQ